MPLAHLERAVIEQKRREPYNCVHRGSQLVRHVRQESGLCVAIERKPAVLLGQHPIALLEFRPCGLDGFRSAAKLEGAVFQTRCQ
jgi:hypothetical protein